MITQSPASARSGLFTHQSESRVPLTGVSVEASISDLYARVVVTQRYINREPTAIEAVYVFPLDEGAAVCGFEAVIDGTLVIGRVSEREEAFKEYDDAMERGDGAFLLDEERPDVFQASIGNLPPGKEVLVRVSYVTELAAEGTGLRFTVPTTVSPRYAPADDRIGIGRSDEEALNPPRMWDVPYGFELTAHLRTRGAITRLESPSHPIALSLHGSNATVRLSAREAALDRDFILVVDAEGIDRPCASVERGADGRTAVAVAFVPQTAARQVPAEIVFLVDRSGSMGGDSIEEVRNALQLCLRSLIAGCRFNIIGFGSTHQALFPESRPYDEASLAEASQHVAGLEADLGGTEILPALAFALESKGVPELSRQLVVLTDGEVSNTDAVLQLARQHSRTTRVFTFGIGAGASHHLVKGLARAGRGCAEFIFPHERIEPKVVRQIGRLLSPAMTDIAIDWGGLGVTLATAAMPPVFAGDRFIAYGFMNGSGAATARLSATTPSGAVAFDVPVDGTQPSDGKVVAALAARARIRELEEGPDWLTSRGSRQSDRKAGAARDEIVRLATTYGLMSRETSFVAVEHREAPLVGSVELRRVPTAITAGWGGLRPIRPGAAPPSPAARLLGSMPSTATQAGWGACPPTASMAPRPTGIRSTTQNLSYAFPPPGHRGAGRRAVPPPRPPAPMHQLVALQRADGSWELTQALATAMGASLAQLEQGLQGATGAPEETRRAWATALALAWLQSYAADVADQWKLLADKARHHLATINATPEGGGSWIDKAAAFQVTPRS